MLTDQHIPLLSPLKKDYDVLKMGRSRRRVDVVSAPEMEPRETPGERQQEVGKKPKKRPGRLEVVIASNIENVVFIIYSINLVFLFIRF